MKVSKRIKQELETIRRKRRGLLFPEAIVAYARDPETALHSCFEWNDTAAAEAYRLVQAKYLIRMTVTTIEGSNEPTRMYVSLSSDRKDDGVYRLVTDVLSDDRKREELLADALAELSAFKRKYNVLKELENIFAAIDGVRKTG